MEDDYFHHNNFIRWAILDYVREESKYFFYYNYGNYMIIFNLKLYYTKNYAYLNNYSFFFRL